MNTYRLTIECDVISTLSLEELKKRVLNVSTTDVCDNLKHEQFLTMNDEEWIRDVKIIK